MDTIADGVVAVIHYTLKNDQGDILDSSDGGEPLPYLHGANNIVPGLEAALAGKAVGEELNVVVAPEQGYGVRDPGRIQEVPREAFPADAEVAPGAQFVMQDEGGQVIPIWIAQVTDETVTIDANHPLAGQTLHFEIKIDSLRAPTEEETAHGHPHGISGTEAHH